MKLLYVHRLLFRIFRIILHNRCDYVHEAALINNEPVLKALEIPLFPYSSLDDKRVTVLNLENLI